ncbi:type 1 fimbrial protein [Xenorhabdus cabanillasii]|uniref:Exported protein n=1 Tax=Xenorhabdus cabanillasii JM26 TaxID=1427517 RepID=W1IRY6_9GAMM|nr:type 1 fimbrial protein [Xenorhabdus cabanillasii]PHM75901.1 S-fimbrial protein subunit precursor [Xenorhabdus cabanillasii JM26]CDL79970.1 putative exported protein [Xenorhabdus cabanillasii JM26]
MKTKLLKLAVFMTALTPSLLLSTALANSSINSGIIHFSGEIVSPPCEIESKGDEKTEVHCFTESKKITKTVNPKTLKGELTNNLSSISVKHASKNMAILIISHH